MVLCSISCIVSNAQSRPRNCAGRYNAVQLREKHDLNKNKERRKADKRQEQLWTCQVAERWGRNHMKLRQRNVTVAKVRGKQ
ncbi:hypothetical protein CC78DRAFT_219356 [Lojkania enalia]|uniref:Uncharacterized protein n=1 Tax=Lojkania enalia TaxID=147567 RepID=A0A9P4N4H6_9PLEO|nr:hypothetical protein CC78DRAFT_219356 [Didymosphaeria enalia]